MKSSCSRLNEQTASAEATLLRQLRLRVYENDARRKLRNIRLLEEVERVGERVEQMAVQTERMYLLKRQYESLLPAECSNNHSHTVSGNTANNALINDSSVLCELLDSSPLSTPSLLAESESSLNQAENTVLQRNNGDQPAGKCLQQVDTIARAPSLCHYTSATAGGNGVIGNHQHPPLNGEQTNNSELIGPTVLHTEDSGSQNNSFSARIRQWRNFVMDDNQWRLSSPAEFSHTNIRNAACAGTSSCINAGDTTVQHKSHNEAEDQSVVKSDDCLSSGELVMRLQPNNNSVPSVKTLVSREHGEDLTPAATGNLESADCESYADVESREYHGLMDRAVGGSSDVARLEDVCDPALAAQSDVPQEHDHSSGPSVDGCDVERECCAQIDGTSVASHVGGVSVVPAKRDEDDSDGRGVLIVENRSNPASLSAGKDTVPVAAIDDSSEDCSSVELTVNKPPLQHPSLADFRVRVDSDSESYHLSREIGAAADDGDTDDDFWGD